ncbi:MAG: hypothetical protein MZV70_17615 [Desulfobacterales bacterium]|nr:hypothetical protein [Desulfobacterales bacterium]
MLGVDEDDDLIDTASDGRRAQRPQDFTQMILENLEGRRRAEHASRDQRLTFDAPRTLRRATWIHAAGDYTEKDGTPQARRHLRSAPSSARSAPDQVKEAAKEAVRGVGFDLLIVCGFAFDPHVTEEAKRYGRTHRPPGPDEPRPARWATNCSRRPARATSSWSSASPTSIS